MKKSELVKKISDSAHISQDAASIAIDRTFDFIKSSLKENKKITIAGFGSFAVQRRKKNIGENRKAAESKIKEKLSRTVSFKPSPKIDDVL
ncbi:HU family DNA-binding protein [Candidatus Sumerlaeota bacterium]|nr:HU family DNA-binding protein [Candidatus Sumerlaeota bacterium]